MTAPARPAYGLNPVVRVVLIVLLVIAAIILAIVGGFDHGVNPTHWFAFAIICVAVGLALAAL